MTDPLLISITVSDPWDFGEAVNWQAIPGQLLQTKNADHGGRALVKFDHPVSIVARYIATLLRRRAMRAVSSTKLKRERALIARSLASPISKRTQAVPWT